MRIQEQNTDRIVVTRGSGFDRLFFSVYIVAGLAMILFSGQMEPPVWLWLLLGVTFIAGGGYFWSMSGNLTLTLDRRSGLAQLDWQQPRRSQRQRALLDDILELRVEGNQDADRLVFALKNGKTLPLTPYSYTGGDHPKIRSAVNAWLANTG